MTISYEVRMSDTVENTGLDGVRFATLEEAEMAAAAVNAEYARAKAEASSTIGEPTTTFEAWSEAAW